MNLARFLGAMSIAVAIVASAHVACAERRPEAAARDALKKAEDDYLRLAFDKALERLQKAERACGERSCTPATLAALLRDIGTMQFRLDQHDAALASFKRAKKLDPNVTLNPSYDARDLHEAWEGTATPVPSATGDFVHKPADEQTATTPLPVYVEPQTSEELASVVVRYKNEQMKSFRRAVLKKMGTGWGGTIPCGDVVPGKIDYYLQGFDKNGELVANSGDAKKVFTVPIREGAVATAPRLPGQSPPTKCVGEDLQALNLDEGDRCKEDRQCKSGTCSSGRCKAASPEAETEVDEPTATGPRPFPRFWIGIAGSLDMTAPSSGSDVCKQSSSGASSSGYWCTTASGSDFPGNAVENRAIVSGRGGTPATDFTTGGVHVTATFDYAALANLLVGLRLGFVANAYPGSAASTAGKTIGPPLHVEARGTWVFGDDPLAHAGLAPYAFAAAGVARFDVSTTVMVGLSNVAGDRAVQAWRVGGPAFGAIGGGGRYAFSPRIAFDAGLGLDAAIGPGAFAISLAPELHLQYGF